MFIDTQESKMDFDTLSRMAEVSTICRDGHQEWKECEDGEMDSVDSVRLREME